MGLLEDLGRVEHLYFHLARMEGLPGYTAEKLILQPVRSLMSTPSTLAMMEISTVRPSVRQIPIHEPHQLAKQPDLCCRLPSSIPARGAFRKARVHRGHHIPIVIEPPGNVAYATSYHTGDLLAYSVNQNDGSLAPLQTVNADAMYLDNRSPWSRAVRT